MYLLYLCIKKSQRSTIGDGSPLTVYLFPSQKVLPMYLLYLCIKKSQRSTIGDGSPLTVMYSLLRKYYPCTFCTCAKKKSAVNHQRWFSADCYVFPSQKVLPMYLLYLCIKKSQRSTIGDGSPLTVYLFPSQKVLPMYLLYLCKIQVSGRQPSAMVLR